MSISNDIYTLIHRLKRAEIDVDHLCYEIDEADWPQWLEYLNGFGRYQDKDLTYIEEMTFMGLKVRKRPAQRTNSAHE